MQEETLTKPGYHDLNRLSIRSVVFYGLMICWVCFQSGCSSEQPEPEILTVSDDIARQDALDIRSSEVITVADGLDLSLWASEKLIRDPVALHMDPQGRAWLTVTTRRSRSEISVTRNQAWMEASLGFTSVEEKRDFIRSEFSPENNNDRSGIQDRNEDGSSDWRDLTVLKEEVWRVEDQSGDGLADHSQLFIRDFHEEVTDIAGAIVTLGDDVFVGVGPDMWKIRDTNNDGIGDMKESLIHGFNIHIGISGHGMSGARIGPDGRLYWGVGDHGLHVVDREGKDWFYPTQGSIVRSEPDGSNFEVFAAGLRNTHEFAFDKYGNLISVDNDGDHSGEFERIVYPIHGSDSGWRTYWQFGKYSDPNNNSYKVWMDENYFRPEPDNPAAHVLPPIAAYHDGPTGMIYNPGTGLNDQWADHFFISLFPAAAPRAVINAFSLTPKGASFELTSDETVVQGVLASGIDFGPDGALYMADWIQGWGPNEMGRIWKLDSITGADSPVRMETKRLLEGDFSVRPEVELVQLLGHEDMRVRQKAQFELVEREAISGLLSAVENSNNQLARIHGIWGVAQAGRHNPELAGSLTGYLSDEDVEIRAQTVRMLGDIPLESSAESIIPLLADENARVKLFAAEALGRIKYRPAFGPVVEMIEKNFDGDSYLRYAGAIALERIGDVESIADLENHPSRDVRTAAVIALKRLESPAVTVFLDDEDEYIVTNAARAISDDDFVEEALPALAAMLEQSRFINEPLLRRAINANLYLGGPVAAQRLSNFSLREDIAEELKAEALRTLSVWGQPSFFDRVTGRQRGQIQRSPDDAKEALSTVFGDLLATESNMIRLSVLEAVSKLQYAQAMDAVFSILQQDISADVRIAALSTLSDLGFDRIDEAIELALADENESVRLAALGLLPELGLPDQTTVDLLVSRMENGALDEQRIVIETLGGLQNSASVEALATLLDRLADDEIPPEIQLDLLEAIDEINDDSLHDRVAQYHASKPVDNPLVQYRESLMGGAAGSGRRIFLQHAEAQCVRCHIVEGQGGEVGPDLTNVAGRLSREELLLAIVDPTAQLSPGYGVVDITLQSGDSVRGILEEETNGSLTVAVSDGTQRFIEKNEITSRQNLPSAMPVLDTTVLTRAEIRDLVEYLSSLTLDD